MISPEIRQQIAAASLCSTGQGIPWQSLFAKKQITVGFLGGSVTNGYLSGQTLEAAYPTLVCEGLREAGCEVKQVMLAAPGMDTMIGNLLTNEIILSEQPDLVFLEFAINETTLRHSVMSFESLIRKLLTAEKPPIVCIFLVRSASGYSCDGFMAPMAEHYGLPLVNLRKGIEPALEQGGLVWTDYADEESHPCPAGHQLLADCLLHLLKTAMQLPDEPAQALPELWLDAPFADLRYLRPADTGIRPDMLVSRYNWAFPLAWRLSPEQPELTLHIRCRVLVLFYEMHHLPEYGSCRVTIDGKPMKHSYLMKDEVLHGDSVYGWGNPVYVPAIQSEQAADHTITLTSEEKHFYLLGIGYCE